MKSMNQSVKNTKLAIIGAGPSGMSQMAAFAQAK
jgi:cation diffusion facilitator CzcD-associated flavoprotein CzcO